MAKENKKTYGVVAWLNALVERGWLTVLTEAEVKLWIVLAKFADKECESWPGGATAARLIGHRHDNHIAKLRRSLEGYGLIETVASGGGRGNECTVRVLYPPETPKTTKIDTRKPSQHGRDSRVAETLPTREVLEPETLPSRYVNPPVVVAKPSRTGTPYKEDPSNDPSNDPSRIHTARSASGVIANIPPEAVIAEDKKLSLQARVMRDVWEPKWANAHHGAEYSPGKLDFIKLAEILKQLGAAGDEPRAIGRFEKIADAALEQPEEFGWQGCKLSVVHKNLPFLISLVSSKQNGATRATGSRPNSKPDRTIQEEIALR